jgi:hypothetical protein
LQTGFCADAGKWALAINSVLKIKEKQEMKKVNRIFFALILLFALLMPLNILYFSSAQTYTRNNTEKTYAFVGAAPNPVQVGTRVLLHYGISYQGGSATITVWQGMTINIVTPENKNETICCQPTDSTGASSLYYVPTMVGNYTLQSFFPEQRAPSTNAGIPANITMLASISEPLTLVVQEEPLATWPGVPVPDEYWTRPINAQLYQWTPIGGDWLEHKAFFASTEAPFNEFAPESAHVLWTKPYAAGGLLAGGADISSPSEQTTNEIDYGYFGYETGAAYNDQFLNSIIISGVLFYNRYENRGGTNIEQEVVAVDLHTGVQLWDKPLIGKTGITTGATVAAANVTWEGQSTQYPNGIPRRLAFGQTFMWASYNLMGAYGLLWTTSGTTWMAFDAYSGRWIYTITNVPSGTTIRGENGELLRFVINQAQGTMGLWNSSALVSLAGSWDPHGNVYNASGVTSSGELAAGPARAWMWNVTIPKGLPGSVQAIKLGDKVFGLSVGLYTVSSWELSLKKGQEGQVIQNTNWAAPTSWAEANRTSSIRINAVDLDYNVFVVVNCDAREQWGFSTDTGQKIWGPTEPQNYLEMYQEAMAFSTRDGRLLLGTSSGIIQCRNITTGELIWTHAVIDPFHTNYVGVNWPLRAPAAIVVDGKLYGGYGEHSPNQPLPVAGPFFCLNLTTGDEIWSQYMCCCSYSYTPLIGDSIIAALNVYDNQIYAIGKGPSVMTVEAPMTSNELGKSLVIRGTVMDGAPGLKDAALAVRFPKGVAAVSDASMSEWMRYVFMQFPRPTNTTGVEVNVYVVDSNNNYRLIGSTTSDDTGDFSLTWKPDVPGNYTVIASFDGSNSYYPSFAKSSFVVDEPVTPQTTEQPQTVALPPFEVYIAAATVAIIVAIAVATVLIIKKKP